MIPHLTTLCINKYVSCPSFDDGCDLHGVGVTDLSIECDVEVQQVYAFCWDRILCDIGERSVCPHVVCGPDLCMWGLELCTWGVGTGVMYMEPGD